jgi:hypothetical protein
VLIQGLDVANGGFCFVRFHGCDVDWTGGIFAFDNGQAEAAVDILGQAGGGSYTLRSLVVDNEGTAFKHALVRCELHPFTQCSLILESLIAAQVGPDAAWLLLKGARPDLPHFFKSGFVRVTAPRGPNLRAAVEVRGKGWFGEFDARLLPVRTKVGDAEQIRVLDDNPFVPPAKK